MRSSKTGGVALIHAGQWTKLTPLRRVAGLLGVLTLLCWNATGANASIDSTKVSLQFENQGLDLDTGQVLDASNFSRDVFRSHASIDVFIAYNARRTVHQVVINNELSNVRMAFLESTQYESVQDVSGLSFVAGAVDRPFGVGDTIVVKTDEGRHFKIGHPIADLEAGTVTIDYQSLDPRQGSVVAPLSPETEQNFDLALDSAPRTSITESLDYAPEADELREHELLFGEANVVGPPVVHEDARLMATDGEPRDFFGSVAIFGDTVVVGANSDGDNGFKSGSAYVFEHSGTTWNQQYKILPSDGAAGDRFGFAVDVFADTVIAGASSNDDNGTDSGSAYVFVRNGSSWAEEAKLVASDAGGRALFGFSVALHGNTAIVGAPRVDDQCTDCGAAYVFVRTGTTWTEEAKLLPSGSFGLFSSFMFGESVAIDGNTIVVGAPLADATHRDSGAAYVFVRTGSTWTEQATLTGDRSGGSFGGDNLGQSVAISGDMVVAGAPNDDVPFIEAGSAYVFVRNDTTWSRRQELAASDRTSFEWFGWSVAIAGERIIIGTLLDSGNSFRSGSAYVFEPDGMRWEERAKLLASDGAADDRLGFSTAAMPGTVVVGGFMDSSSRPGTAYVFELNQPPVARCADVIVVTDEASCSADASIDAGSYDPDGDPMAVEQLPMGPYGLGQTAVSLTVMDAKGATSSCAATVIVKDETPPSIRLHVLPNVLWPPNQRMVDVHAAVETWDNCGAVEIALTSVVNSELATMKGEGSIGNDIQGVVAGTPDVDFLLRAKRDGHGDGRLYTVVYTATDDSANESIGQAVVVVPHDLGVASSVSSSQETNRAE